MNSCIEHNSFTGNQQPRPRMLGCCMMTQNHTTASSNLPYMHNGSLHDRRISNINFATMKYNTGTSHMQHWKDSLDVSKVRVLLFLDRPQLQSNHTEATQRYVCLCASDTRHAHEVRYLFVTAKFHSYIPHTVHELLLLWFLCW